MARRQYVDNAPTATIAGQISASATSFVVSSLAGFPAATPYLVTVDRGTASAELMLVTGVAGTTVTVTRNANGLGASSHTAGATFEHTLAAQDLDEANAHVNASQQVHGLGAGSAVVGTTDPQTVTNKLLVPVTYAGAAARDTAILSPTAGMVCYLANSGQLFQYDGTAWRPLVQGGIAPAWHDVGAPGEPTYQNGWAVGTNGPTSFAKDAVGVVRLRGGPRNGTVNSVGFTLPVGFRPGQTVSYACSAGGGIFTNVNIGTSGNILLATTSNGGTPTQVLLDGISFLAEG